MRRPATSWSAPRSRGSGGVAAPRNARRRPCASVPRSSVHQPSRIVYTVGTASLSRQGVNGIYRRVALSAFDHGLVEMPIGKVEDAARALSSHSLRVGLTQDLFAAGEDGVGIAQALRWSSPSTALRYGRKLAARSNVAAPVLSRIRS
jgi:hypothetical protein